MSFLLPTFRLSISRIRLSVFLPPTAGNTGISPFNHASIFLTSLEGVYHHSLYFWKNNKVYPNYKMNNPGYSLWLAEAFVLNDPELGPGSVGAWGYTRHMRTCV